MIRFSENDTPEDKKFREDAAKRLQAKNESALGAPDNLYNTIVKRNNAPLDLPKMAADLTAKKQANPEVYNVPERSAGEIYGINAARTFTLGIPEAIASKTDPLFAQGRAQYEEDAAKHPVAGALGTLTGFLAPAVGAEVLAAKALPTLFSGISSATRLALGGIASGAGTGAVQGTSAGIADGETLRGVLGRTAKETYNQALAGGIGGTAFAGLLKAAPYVKELFIGKNVLDTLKPPNTSSGLRVQLGSNSSKIDNPRTNVAQELDPNGNLNLNENGIRTDNGLASRPVERNTLPRQSMPETLQTSEQIGGSSASTPEEQLLHERFKIEPVTEGLEDSFRKLPDRSGFSLYTNNIYRNVDNAFGDLAPEVNEKLIYPLEQSKFDFINMQKQHSDALYNDIVERLGIKKGSKLSAVVQDYGERKLLADEIVQFGKNKEMLEDDLLNAVNNSQQKAVKKDLKWVKDQIQVRTKKLLEVENVKYNDPETYNKIVTADNWFRNQYDKWVDYINRSREIIYPHVEKKMMEINKEIGDLQAAISDANVQKNQMNMGRQYETNKEILLKTQIDKLANKKILLEAKISQSNKESSKALFQKELDSINIKLDVKNQQLELANQFGQPTAKQVSKVADKIDRLEKLLSQKEELIQSEELFRNKRLPKRNDYYRHMREIQGTVQGLMNIFDTPAQISPKLTGLSEFTHPKTKFQSILQKRGMGPYKSDAVGGYLDYIKAGSFATHIDPHIAKLNIFRNELKDVTDKSANINNIIEYLGDYTNDLAGKTNFIDRSVQKLIGRKAMHVINWMHNRVAANTILGNASSAISQFANVPLGVAHIKNPVDISYGIKETTMNMFGKGNLKEVQELSPFLRNRFQGDMISRFDTRLIDQPKKLAVWMLTVADETGTRFIWNSIYNKALRNGIENPLRYADFETRNLVAGRGLGELALIQNSRTFRLIAPFQVEVANAWHVYKDFISKKDFAGIVTLFTANFALNKAREAIGLSGIGLDPIGATMDAFGEDSGVPENKKTTMLQKAGRLGGEVLTNLPLGANIANEFPEATRKKYFGREDPTRFGTGLLSTRALQDPIYKLLPNFGGNQIKKIVEGISEVNNGGVYKEDAKGRKKLMYKIPQTPANYFRAGLLGKNTLDEAVDYFNKKRN